MEHGVRQLRYCYEFFIVRIIGINHADLIYSLQQRPHCTVKVMVLERIHLILNKRDRLFQAGKLSAFRSPRSWLMRETAGYILHPQWQVLVLEIVQLLQQPARRKIKLYLKVIENVSMS